MKAKYVLFYEAAADFRAKVPAHFEAHRALWGTFRDNGRLLMIVGGLLTSVAVFLLVVLVFGPKEDRP